MKQALKSVISQVQQLKQKTTKISLFEATVYNATHNMYYTYSENFTFKSVINCILDEFTFAPEASFSDNKCVD